MRFLLTLWCCLYVFAATAQDAGKRPAVGLTLSGGGAKGLAHIGILKAIDSAGLKIDYITGTSNAKLIGMASCNIWRLLMVNCRLPYPLTVLIK